MKSCTTICTSNIRRKTISLFFCCLVFMVFFIGIINISLRSIFSSADNAACENNIVRYTQASLSDAQSMLHLLLQYSTWDDSVIAYEDLLNSPNGSSEVFDYWVSEDFTYEGAPSELDINIVACYDTNFRHLFSTYFLPDYVNGFQASDTQTTVPTWFKTGNLSVLINGSSSLQFQGLLVPPKEYENERAPALIAAMLPIYFGTVRDTTHHGWLLWGKEIRPRLKQYSDSIPSCLTAWNLGDNLDHPLPTAAQEAVESLVASKIGSTGFWEGAKKTEIVDSESISKEEGRHCPYLNIYDTNTSKSVTTFFLLSDGFDGHPNGPLIRLDRMQAMLQMSALPISLIFVMALIVILVIGGILISYIDLHVLRRVVKLSTIVMQATIPVTLAVSPALTEVEKRQNSTRNLLGLARSQTPSKSPALGNYSSSAAQLANVPAGYFSDSDDETAEKKRQKKKDEIEHLKSVVRTNIDNAKARVAEATKAVKEEGRIKVRHRDAMRLLNLWCGRKNDIFPGLRKEAKTDPRTPRGYSLESLLSNPIGVEFLKAHCKTESSLENVMFLLDVNWLHELEAAEETEIEPMNREILHNNCIAAAKTILSQYIISGAPCEINLSSEAIKHLNVGHFVYSVGVFQEAFTEIQYMFDTDVLNRFRATPAYTALCEILDIESGSTVIPQELSTSTTNIIAVETKSKQLRRPSDYDSGDMDEEEDRNEQPSTKALNAAFSHAFTRLRLRAMSSPHRREPSFVIVDAPSTTDNSNSNNTSNVTTPQKPKTNNNNN